MIQTNHNMSAETDKISRETNDLSKSGGIKEETWLVLRRMCFSMSLLSAFLFSTVRYGVRALVYLHGRLFARVRMCVGVCLSVHEHRR